LLIALPVMAANAPDGWPARFDAFYRAGALVFGGGHVVLPLLKEAIVQPGWISPDRFLAGYGAAQALPGPLFTVAAFLGATMSAPYGGIAGALLGLAAIFLPGFLILVGVLPFWEALRQRPRAQAAMAGTNAAVVGILAGALYDPLWIGAVADRLDVAIAAAGFILLSVFRTPAIVVVIALGLAGVVRTAIGV
jgi:chromate transporter